MVMPSPPPESSGHLPEDPPEPSISLDEFERQRRAQLLTSRRLRAAVAKIARCHGVPDEDIEDVVQETLRRALHAKLPAAEGEATMYTSGIAAHVSRDHMAELRARGAEQSYVEEGEDGGLLPSEASAQPAYFEEREAVERIIEAGRERFPRTFPWFVRARVDGDTSEEIGNDHGVSAGRVRREIVDVQRFVAAYGQKLGVAVAVMIAVVFGAHWLRRGEEPGETATYVVRRNEAPPLDADQLRERAQKELVARQWRACVDDLDAAERMDPVGAPRFRAMRAAAESQARMREVTRDWWYGRAKPK